jgi:carbonic anhydrase
MSEEITRLIEGNKIFRDTYFGNDRTIFDGLIAHGQQPKIMIVACSDSRVDPAMIFNCQPGQLFVVRNIANLVPPCEDNNSNHGTSAALEFGVRYLNVEHLIVLGHTQCGGIRALLETGCDLESKEPSFIAKWMEIARKACDTTMAEHRALSLEEQMTVCCHYALINSLHNLKTFPWINERVQAGLLTLHAWYFDFEIGGIHQYDPEHQQWNF